jgi:hypothetical protein
MSIEVAAIPSLGIHSSNPVQFGTSQSFSAHCRARIEGNKFLPNAQLRLPHRRAFSLALRLLSQTPCALSHKRAQSKALRSEPSLHHPSHSPIRPHALPSRMRRWRRRHHTTASTANLTVAIAPNSGSVLLGNSLSFSATSGTACKSTTSLPARFPQQIPSPCKPPSPESHNLLFRANHRHQSRPPISTKPPLPACWRFNEQE